MKYQIKYIRFSIGITAFIIGLVAASFSKMDKFSSSYFAPIDNGFGIGTSSGPINANSFPNWLNSTTAPPRGNMSGACSSFAGYICAALFTVKTGNQPGVYLNSNVTGEYHY